MGKRQALLRRVTVSASQAGSLAGYVYGESRRRGAAAGALSGGPASVEDPGRPRRGHGFDRGGSRRSYRRPFPATASYRCPASDRGREGPESRAIVFGALIESARGADPVPARTPVLSSMVDE